MRGKTWTEAETNYVRDNYQHMSLRTLSEKIGRPYLSVKKRCFQMGFKCYAADKRKDINFDIFDNLNSDSSYFLGFAMADGYFKSGGVEITLNKKDIEILQYFQNIIYNDKKDRVRPTQKTKMIRLDILSVKLVKLLKKYYIFPGPKTMKEFLPKNIPDQLISDFIRGYFDGDGWCTVTNKKQLSCGICSGSKKLLISFQKFLGFGKISKLRNIWQIRFYKCDLKYLQKIFYPDNRFALNRKKDALFLTLETTERKCYNSLDVKFLLENLREDNIKEISLQMGRSVDEIRRKGKTLGLIKPIWGKVLYNVSN